MAVIVPFREFHGARRREHACALTEECIDILAANLRQAMASFEQATDDERSTYARRIRHLGELLEYAVRTL